MTSPTLTDPATPTRSTDPDSTIRTSWSYRLAFSALVAGAMSILIGGALSVIANGLDGALAAFIETAPVAFAVAFPASLFAVPAVQRLTDRLFGLG